MMQYATVVQGMDSNATNYKWYKVTINTETYSVFMHHVMIFQMYMDVFTI